MNDCMEDNRKALCGFAISWQGAAINHYALNTNRLSRIVGDARCSEANCRPIRIRYVGPCQGRHFLEMTLLDCRRGDDLHVIVQRLLAGLLDKFGTTNRGNT